MGELLRKGARMLSDTCPECNTPLFQLNDGSLICPMCNKPVVKVSSDADIEVISYQENIEQTLLNKVKEIQIMLEAEKDPQKINALLETLMKLLDTREKIRKLH
jgi:UPF0148 protein